MRNALLVVGLLGALAANVAAQGERRQGVPVDQDVRLVRAANEIKRVFGSRDQDIEWAYMKGQIYIVQARPYIAGG